MQAEGMHRALLSSLKRFFRSPATIVGELLSITLFGVLGAALPQAGAAPASEVARLRTHGALFTALVDALALDHVFTSPLFLIALAMATVSLAIVVLEQIRRLIAQWRMVLTEGHFRNAPFRREFSRPASSGSRQSIAVRGRLGLAGSPLFHLGLLGVILAGVLRALFSVEAVVDLYEGETLPATAEAWGAQWPGPLASPFRLDAPLTLLSLENSRYPSGELKALRLRLALEGPSGPQTHELSVNEELPTQRGRLYMDAKHGPAAIVEWSLPSALPQRTAALLEQKEAQAFGTYVHGPDSLVARLRVPMPKDGSRPDRIEARAIREGATLAEAALRPGEALPLPGGGQLRLLALPYWARVHANSDPALGLAYVGFALILIGAALTYSVIRVDEFVAVVPEGERERVVVAMKPYRFVPLFQERFARLVREHGGEV